MSSGAAGTSIRGAVCLAALGQTTTPDVVTPGPVSKGDCLTATKP